MPPRGGDFRQRLEHEPAAVKPAVRKRQRLRGEPLAADVEEIDVDRPRAVGKARPTPPAALDALDRRQELERRKGRADLDDGVEEIPLAGVSLRRRFVDRGAADDRRDPEIAWRAAFRWSRRRPTLLPSAR